MSPGICSLKGIQRGHAILPYQLQTKCLLELSQPARTESAKQAPEDSFVFLNFNTPLDIAAKW